MHECGLEPRHRRPRGHLVVILVFFAVLMYAPVLLALKVTPTLVGPTTAAICLLAIRVARRMLDMIDGQVRYLPASVG